MSALVPAEVTPGAYSSFIAPCWCDCMALTSLVSSAAVGSWLRWESLNLRMCACAGGSFEYSLAAAGTGGPTRGEDE